MASLIPFLFPFALHTKFLDVFQVLKKNVTFFKKISLTPEMHLFPDTLNFPFFILITFVVYGYKLYEGKIIVYSLYIQCHVQHPTYNKCPRNISWHEQVNDYLEAIF